MGTVEVDAEPNLNINAGQNILINEYSLKDQECSPHPVWRNDIPILHIKEKHQVKVFGYAPIRVTKTICKYN